MFRFRSVQLAFLNQFSGPMPTFWAGIDQIVNVSRGGRMAFLLGESSDQGYWQFFPSSVFGKDAAGAACWFAIAFVGWVETAVCQTQTVLSLYPNTTLFFRECVERH